MARILCFVLILIHFLVIECAITCKNNAGQPVDWFVVYKLPRGSNSKLSKSKQSASQRQRRFGTEMAYMDPSSLDWQTDGLNVNSTSNAVYHTLQQIYDNKESDKVLYIMYNDQKPNKDAPSSRGHSKGVVSFDAQAGFWLVHSVPRFPPYVKDDYSYPDSGTVFGQTMLCISLPASALPAVAQQLVYIYTAMYEKNIPQMFTTDPAVQALNSDNRRTSPPWNNTVPLTTIHGQRFVSFAKSRDFGQDLYENLVAPGLRSDLLVETWKNGEPLIQSNCVSEFKVINVEDVKVLTVSIPGKADHAKWAIAASHPQQSWVCVGDINRQKTQFKRGGGTVCSQLPIVWKAFTKSVVDSDQCPH